MNALERKMRKLTDDELMRHCTCYDHCCAACVEGDRRYEQKLRDEARAEERAAIVAWLREDAKRFEGRKTIAVDEHPDETTLETLLYAADAIERGDYRRGKP